MKNLQIENEIIEYFKNHSNMTKLGVASAIPKFIRNCDKNILNYLNNILNEISEYEKIENIIKSIIFNIELKYCATCGKLMKFSQLKHNFCSNKCIGKNENIKRKKYDTLIKNYGNDLSEIYKQINEHSKQTCLKKYGVEHVSQTQQFKDKVKSTNLEKYGVENPLQSNEIRNKIKNTLKEKYGTENISQSEYWHEKVKETSLKKYGVENYLQTKECKNLSKEYINAHKDEIIEKRKNTCIEKYGKEHWMQTDEAIKVKDKVKEYVKSNDYKEKVKNTNLKRYGKSHKNIVESWNHIQTLDYIKPLFSFEEFEGGCKKWYKWQCMVCGYEFESPYSDGNVVFKCPKCKFKNCFKSNMEKELADFCRQFFSEIKENDKKLIHACELDIVIPEIKLAIEFNGSYWHSFKVWKEKHSENTWNEYFGRHLNKVLKCNEIGYRLIHIWEDEWINDKESIKQRLKDIFGNKEVIDFSKPLDRSWYNNIKNSGYHVIKEIKPELIDRNGYKVENCGYLLFTRDDNDQVFQADDHV